MMGTINAFAKVGFRCGNPFECGRDRPPGMLALPLDDGQSNGMSYLCFAPQCRYLELGNLDILHIITEEG